jgi:hypothetical protein
MNQQILRADAWRGTPAHRGLQRFARDLVQTKGPRTMPFPADAASGFAFAVSLTKTGELDRVD